ncbi:hypothetical protein U1Q18_047934 [Sarracenia purpurea var. burkii]
MALAGYTAWTNLTQLLSDDHVAVFWLQWDHQNGCLELKTRRDEATARQDAAAAEIPGAATTTVENTASGGGTGFRREP